VADMTSTLTDELTLDAFSALQNGSLVPVFANLDDGHKDHLPSSYPDSTLAKVVDSGNDEQTVAFSKIASAFEGFLGYLRDDNVIVDHRYLWDLVTLPNELLFPAGLNLVILEEGEGDGTNDVRVLCPTNPYVRKLFNATRPTAVLLLRDHVYELIVVYEDRKTEYAVTKLFMPGGRHKGLLRAVVTQLLKIGKAIDTRCRPLPSLPKIYDYKANVTAMEAMDALTKANFSIRSKVINYNGKVVGFEVKRGKRKGFIPCFPSSLEADDTHKTVWIGDVGGNSYKDTLTLLDQVAKETKSLSPILPHSKLVEDGLIVGVLTNSNQFIPVDPPEQDTYGEDYPVIHSGDPFEANVVALTSSKVDDERVMTMKRIRVETMFFDAFRNQVRVMLTAYPNAGVRGELVSLLETAETEYYTKLQSAAGLLQKLVGKQVQFAEMSDDLIEDVMKESGTTGITLCGPTDEECTMVVPKRNLINGIDNENAYFVRVADELIRYGRIRNFLLSPDAFLSFNEVKYRLNKDEIVLLQSLLTQSYFEGLVPRDSNPYRIGSSYDMAEPAKTEHYSEIAQLKPTAPGEEKAEEPEEEEEEESACPKPDIVKVTGKWVKVFPKGTEELVFPNEPAECTFQVVIAIANRSATSATTVTLSVAKEALGRQYEKLWPDYAAKILAVLAGEGKKALVTRIREGSTNLEAEITNATYACSNLDMWLLAKHYKLPIVLYSSTKFSPSGLPIRPLYVGAKKNDFYFIKVPGSRSKASAKYRLAIKGRSAAVPLTALREGMGKVLDKALDDNKGTLEAYLDEFKAIKLKAVAEFSSKGKVTL